MIQFDAAILHQKNKKSLKNILAFYSKTQNYLPKVTYTKIEIPLHKKLEIYKHIMTGKLVWFA